MREISAIKDFQNAFFIGVAGAGMSAIAQYLQGMGKNISGSDRFFTAGEKNATQLKLEAAGIKCFPQDGSGLNDNTEVVIASTAIEDTVEEMVLARKMGIPVIRRSNILSLIANDKMTIAVAGTSGKSTTAAMLFHILNYAGLQPSIITGAGLTPFIREGKIGNAYVGKGEWLVIEADESDGSIVQYNPEVGLLLNIEKDHKDLEVLEDLFMQFRSNTRGFFVVNAGNLYAKELSENKKKDFGVEVDCGYVASDYTQDGFVISFKLNGTPFTINAPGSHTMENATAASAVAAQLGVSLPVCAKAMESYEGIYRRHQLVGKKHGIWLIDDYAHNPAKCAASIAACQAISPKVVAWFQPHGYGPTKFLKEEFIKEIAEVLREEDEIWMSEIYYAGGTAVKDISAKELTDGIQALGKKAYFVEDRNNLVEEVQSHLASGEVLLLMGARDPGLETFAREVYERL